MGSEMKKTEKTFINLENLSTFIGKLEYCYGFFNQI